jgi:hypothetical protein
MNARAKSNHHANAGHDVIANMYFRFVVPAVTFGVALVAFELFGLTWGLLSVPLTLIMVIAFYSFCCWAIESWFEESHNHDRTSFDQTEDMSEHLQRINEQSGEAD